MISNEKFQQQLANLWDFIIYWIDYNIVNTNGSMELYQYAVVNKHVWAVNGDVDKQAET